MGVQGLGVVLEGYRKGSMVLCEFRGRGTILPSFCEGLGFRVHLTS